MNSTRTHHRRRAGGLIVALVTLLVVMLIAGSIVRSLVVDSRESRVQATELQTHCLADAALARAAVKLKTQADYTGETWRPEIYATDETEVGVAEIRVERPAKENVPLKITVEARYPDHPWKRVAVARALIIPQESAP